MSQPYSVFIFDIEGTTTAISFVTETLFPFAAAHLEAFLNSHFDDLTEIIDAFRTQAEQDVNAGRTDAVLIPKDNREAILETVLFNALAQIKADRKITPLKAIQGQIWAEGYRRGTLKGHVFDDVRSAFEKIVSNQKSIYIYSSGSVQAQKLIFGHSIAGDLRPFISGYFDTNIGHKVEATSYRRIAKEIGTPSSDILFLTDKLSEAQAAAQAGCHVVILNRPGNPDQPAHNIETWVDFKKLGDG